MSDLVSTPSRTQSTVSNEAFEALIDLLASDGIDETSSKAPGDVSRSQPIVTLRDPSGKLDFDKIRLMFAVQNDTRRASTIQEEAGTQIQFSTEAHEDGDSDDEQHSHRSSSTVPSRSNSMSPKPVDSRPTAGHRRSSTFGNQPWLGIHENATTAKQDVTLAPSKQYLSFDELNAALAGAHAEVRSLRQRYDELRALVSKRLGTEEGDQVSIKKITSVKKHTETHAAGSQAQLDVALPPSDLPSEIANLSEDEAKKALGALVHSLNLSPNVIRLSGGTSPKTNSLLSNSLRQHDVASIVCAVKFLGTVDELVWRRTSAPSGPRTLLPVFSEENTVALLARLELWERAVRRSPRA